jgi:hypothetical protein
LGWLEVECARCKTRASLPLEAIRRPRDTPIWKLESSLKCRSCRHGRYAPPVRMIKLTDSQEISPYKWVYPDEEITLQYFRCLLIFYAMKIRFLIDINV